MPHATAMHKWAGSHRQAQSQTAPLEVGTCP